MLIIDAVPGMRKKPKMQQDKLAKAQQTDKKMLAPPETVSQDFVRTDTKSPSFYSFDRQICALQ